MKFIHISDLHLGKRVNEFSMLEDQRDILKKILTVVDEEKPEAVLIAGRSIQPRKSFPAPVFSTSTFFAASARTLLFSTSSLLMNCAVLE